MNRGPSLMSIYAAELRVVQAKLNTRAGFHRLTEATRSAITRPSMLTMVAGTSGLFGFLMNRQRHGPGSPPRRLMSLANLLSVTRLLVAFFQRIRLARSNERLRPSIEAQSSGPK